MAKKRTIPSASADFIPEYRARLVEAFGPQLVVACEESPMGGAWVPDAAPTDATRVTWNWLYALDRGEIMGRCVPVLDSGWIASPFPWNQDQSCATLPEAMAYVEERGSR